MLMVLLQSSRTAVLPLESQSQSSVILPLSAELETMLVSVWQQSLIDKKKTVEVDNETYAVRQTAKSKLRQVDFRFEDRELRCLEQNPNTKSRWANRKVLANYLQA
jgi:hypothetical protein